MERKTVFAAIVSLGAVLALLGGAWYLVNRRNAEACPFCGRGIHRQTQVLVRLGGQNYETCCLRCAITEAQQTGKQLRVLKVADFETTRLLDPDKAWFVEGSRVNYCISMSPAIASPGRESVAMRAFDRCSPSVYAFSTEQQARTFMAQRGGVLKRLDDLLREANSTTGKVQKP